MKVLGTSMDGSVIVELTRRDISVVLDKLLPENEDTGAARPTTRDLLIVAANARYIATMTFDEMARAVIKKTARPGVPPPEGDGVDGEFH